MLDLVNTLEYCVGIGKAGTGTGLESGIPDGIGNMIHLIVILIQIAVPILLIIWGMIDFAKATVGGDDDKIKAGQKTFMKRFIAAIVVFLIVTVTQLVITAVANVVDGGSNDESSAMTTWECAKQIITGKTTAK